MNFIIDKQPNERTMHSYEYGLNNRETDYAFILYGVWLMFSHRTLSVIWCTTTRPYQHIPFMLSTNAQTSSIHITQTTTCKHMDHCELVVFVFLTGKFRFAGVCVSVCVCVFVHTRE